MALPNFDPNGVLPPFTGDPTDPANMSPYPAMPLEFGQQFGTTAERRTILLGWLDLRAVLRQAGFHGAFQWVDGSFLEDIENTEGRAPQDIDVITFFYPPDPNFSATVAANFPILADHPQTKAQFHTDHYLMNLAAHPIRTVDMTAYWCGLFSHRRDGVWKGLLRIEIGHNQGDDDLRNWIAAQP